MRSRSRAERRPPALATTALATLLALAVAGCADGSGDTRPSEGAPSEVRERRTVPAKAPALLESGERVLFIGDSLAVEAPPNYPELLPAALAELGADAVETVNLAEPGTTAADWLPGGELFDQRLEPELSGADVVVLTLGGNDLQEALGAADGVDALSGASLDSAGAALAAIDRLGRQLERITNAIRRRSADARVVSVGYPDYTQAGVWRQTRSDGGLLALELGLSALVGAAESADPDLLIDMRKPTRRAGVDGLLADAEHLGPAGHELYAERLARELTRPQALEAAAAPDS